MTDPRNLIEIIILPDSGQAPAPPPPQPVVHEAPPIPPAAAPSPSRILEPASRPEIGLQILRGALILLLVLSIGFLGRTFFLGSSEDPSAKSPSPSPSPIAAKSASPSPELSPSPSLAPPASPSPSPAPSPSASPSPEPSLSPAPSPSPETSPSPSPEVSPSPSPAPSPLPSPSPSPEAPPEPDPREALFARLLAGLDDLAPVEAIDRLSSALEIHPGRVDLWRKAGDIALGAGLKDRAAEFWSKALDLDPTQHGLRNNLGVLAMQAGRYDEARRHFEEGLRLAPTANVCHNLGNLHFARRDYAKAAHFFRRAVEADATHEAARFNLALAFEKLGRPEEAVAVLSTMHDHVEAARHRARLEAALGGAPAKRAFEEARQTRDAGLAVAAAEGFRTAKEYEKALALYQHAAELEEKDARHVLNRGAVRLVMGNLPDAATDFEAAIALDPRLAEAHFNLGLVAEERKELVKALGHYAEAIRIEPAHAPSHNNVGALYLKVNQPAKAAECFRKAVEADPTFASAHLNLGWASLAAGQPEKALTALETYVALVPADQRNAEAVQTIRRLKENK